MAEFDTIGVVGAGAFGTALATLLAAAGRDVVLWARDEKIAAAVSERRRNEAYLPGIELDSRLRASADPAVLADRRLVLLATPAQASGEVARQLSPHIAIQAAVLVCAKGIERCSGRPMSEVAAAALPDRTIAILSGPTFADELARGLPAAVTLACTDPERAREIRDAVGLPHFRPYLTDDVAGAEIGGAVKNVVAIACGIVRGQGLGQNAWAALMTRGLAEIMRLGRARGARVETLMGLSGLGDLALTCGSEKSRNMSLGIALGEGRRIDEVLGARRAVTEGVATAAALAALAGEMGLELPITAAVDRICNHGAGVGAEIERLLARPFREEGA